MTEPSANIIGRVGLQAEEERRLDKAEIRRTRHQRLVSQHELNATVEATIYGWSGRRARLGERDARRSRTVTDTPMGSRLSASLRERPPDDYAVTKPPGHLGRTR